jgi:hypothetical protein
MAMIDLLVIEAKVLGGLFAKVGVPAVGQQNTTDIQEESVNCGRGHAADCLTRWTTIKNGSPGTGIQSSKKSKVTILSKARPL